MEDALASRLLPLGVSLAWAAEYHPTHGGYRTLGGVCADPDADIHGAIDAVKASLTPAPKEVIIGWLAELSVRAARREHDDFSDALTVEVYASELSRYPADAAKKAIFSGWKFWPSLDAELLPIAERFAKARRAALARLEDAPRPDAPKAPRVTSEQAATIMAAFGRIRKMA